MRWVVYDPTIRSQALRNHVMTAATRSPNPIGTNAISPVNTPSHIVAIETMNRRFPVPLGADATKR